MRPNLMFSAGLVATQFWVVEASAMAQAAADNGEVWFVVLAYVSACAAFATSVWITTRLANVAVAQASRRRQYLRSVPALVAAVVGVLLLLFGLLTAGIGHLAMEWDGAVVPRTSLAFQATLLFNPFVLVLIAATPLALLVLRGICVARWPHADQPVDL